MFLTDLGFVQKTLARPILMVALLLPVAWAQTPIAVRNLSSVCSDDISYFETLDALVVSPLVQSKEVSIVGGYHVENDGGGGLFLLRPESDYPSGPDGGTVLPSTVSGRLWVRWLEGESQDVNLRWFGVGYPAGNAAHFLASTALQTALDLTATRGGRVVIPAGTYRIRDVLPPAGSTILAERGAVISGEASTDVLFRSSGSTGSFQVTGGSWTACDTVWDHDIAATHALINSLFENMAVVNVRVGFSFEAAVNVTWRNVAFVHVETGIAFEGPASCNVNTIDRCRFIEFSGNAIEFLGTGPHVDTAIRGCWFEADTLPSESAIYADANLRSLTVSGCYFEAVGNDTTLAPDVRLAPPSGRGQSMLVFERNYFGPNPTPPPARIATTGLVSFTARDNTVWLHEPSGQVFADVGGGPANPYDVDLFENLLILSQSSTDRYESRLRKTLGQRVSWTAHGTSGYIGDDEDTVVLRQGAPISPPRTLAVTADAGAVNAGLLFLLSDDVKFLEGGTPGQIVRLVCDAPWPTAITLSHRAGIPTGPVADDHVLLAGGADFVFQEGSSVTLMSIDLPSHGRVWIELSRAVVPGP